MKQTLFFALLFWTIDCPISAHSTSFFGENDPCSMVCNLTAPPNIFASCSPGVCQANGVTTTLPSFSPGGCQNGNLLEYNLNNGSWVSVGVGPFPPTTTIANVPVGPNTVTWRLLGNTATQTINVIDNIPPIITCPSNQTRTADPYLCAYQSNSTEFLPTATDNCPNVSIVQIGGLPSGALFPIGSTTLSFKAMDAANNMSQCNFTVTVNPAPPIGYICNNLVNVALDPIGGFYLVQPADLVDGALPCSASSVFASPFFLNCSQLGPNLVTLTVTDNNVTQTCTVTVVLEDKTPPTVTCPADQNVPTDPGLCTFTCTDQSLDPTQLTDNCSIQSQNWLLAGATTGSGTGSLQGHTFNLGTTTIYWTATDGSGNVSPSCSFQITVSSALVVTLNNFSSKCIHVAPFALTGGSPAGGTYSGAGVSGGIFNPSAAGAGLHPITYTYTNGGCSGSATQNINVLPAILSCPNPQTRNLNSQCAVTVPNLTGQIVLNNYCFAGATISQSPAANSQLPMTHNQTTNILVSATLNGYTATCSVPLTAKDLTPPTFAICPSSISVSQPMAANCTLSIPNIMYALTATDNCAGVTKSQSPAPNTVYTNVKHGDSFVVTVTATDAAGLTATCSRTVVAKDNTQPVITACPVPRTVNLTAGCKLPVPNMLSELSATDCSPITKSQNPAAGTLLTSTHNQVHLVTMTATDAGLNAKTCTVALTAYGPGCLVSGPPSGSDRENLEEKTTENEAKSAFFNENQLDLQASPNPFNDELNLSFDLLEAAQTRLVLLSLIGQHTFFSTENWLEKGHQNRVWNTESLPPGVYLVGLKSGERGWIWRKVVLVR